MLTLCLSRLIAKLRKLLPVECFPLSHDLKALSLDSIGPCFLWALSNQIYYMLLILSSSFSCNFMSCSGWSTLRGVDLN